MTSETGMKLTEHFKLEEFTRSPTAQRMGIDNTPTEAAVKNLSNLCRHVLEPLRQWRGGPVCITSGYRCERLNKAVGGAKNSQHKVGEAADMQVPAYDTATTDTNGKGQRLTTEQKIEELHRWFDYIRDNLPFDQLILERESSKSNIYWIHVSCRRDMSKNRKMVIEEMNKH